MDDEIEGENIAATLARVLPEPMCLTNLHGSDPTATDHTVQIIALPPGWMHQELDDEKLLDGPRKAKSVATLNDAESFINFVLAYQREQTRVWCSFNPQTFNLSFQAVIDDHSATDPGWRGHVGTYTPEMSAEWKVWTAANKKAMDQVAFAEFLESYEADIANLPGMPTHGDMMKMALDFQAKADFTIKSKVALQSGGQALDFVSGPDGETTERMKLFDKFGIGIPVFWQQPAEPGETVPAFPLTARLRFRLAAGKVSFWYELVRSDLAHQRAAIELIAEIRTAIGDVPMLMGSST